MGRRGARSEGGEVAGIGAAASSGSVSVVRLESRRPAGPRGGIHVPRALVIINLNKYKINNKQIRPRLSKIFLGKYPSTLTFLIYTVGGGKKFLQNF